MWVGQAWFLILKKECFLSELSGLRHYKVDFEMQSWVGSPSFSGWYPFFYQEDGWHWFSMCYARVIWSPVRGKRLCFNVFKNVILWTHTCIYRKALFTFYLMAVSRGYRMALLYPQCLTYWNRKQWVNWWIHEQLNEGMTRLRAWPKAWTEVQY